MRVLALDTTTRVAAAALVENDRVIAERTGDSSRSHAASLPGELLAVARDAGVELQAIDAFAVAAGPGSFTGLRIGIATIQGLAFVTRRPVVAVSVLEALGHAASMHVSPGAVVAAWMDAHRLEVFAGLYRVTDASPFSPERLVELEAPSVGSPESILQRWMEQFGPPAVVAGDGAVIYADLIGGRIRSIASPVLGGLIGRMAVHRARAGQAVDPAGVQPLYIRRPDAELARDRASGREDL